MTDEPIIGFTQEGARKVARVAEEFNRAPANRTRFRPQPPFSTPVQLPIYNSGDDQIPPYGCCQVVEVVQPDDEQGENYVSVKQADGTATSTTSFVWNSIQAVDGQGFGTAQETPHIRFVFDDLAPGGSGSVTPNPGEMWQPKSGQWTMTKGSGPGALQVLGVLTDDLVDNAAIGISASSAGAAVVAVIDTSGVTAGTPSSPYGQALWAGVLVTVQTTAPTFANDTGGNRFSPMPLPSVSTTTPTCWILDLDSVSGSGGPNPTLVKGEKYVGIPCGTYAVGSVTLPLYAVRKGCQTDVVQITTNNTLISGSGSPTTGQGVKPTNTTTNLFDAQVMAYTPGTTSFSSAPWTNNSISAWLYFVDVPGGSQGSTAPTAVCGDNYVAALLGTFDPYPGGSGGTSDPRPLYFCRRDSTRPPLMLFTSTLFWASSGTPSGYGANEFRGSDAPNVKPTKYRGNPSASAITILAGSMATYDDPIFQVNLDGQWKISLTATLEGNTAFNTTSGNITNNTGYASGAGLPSHTHSYLESGGVPSLLIYVRPFVTTPGGSPSTLSPQFFLSATVTPYGQITVSNDFLLNLQSGSQVTLDVVINSGGSTTVGAILESCLIVAQWVGPYDSGDTGYGESI